MRRIMGRYWLPPRSASDEPSIPKRWRWFIVLSTAGFLLLAGIIAIWLPSYAPVAWALVLFSACHAAFLLVQKVACEPCVCSEPDDWDMGSSGDAA